MSRPNYLVILTDAAPDMRTSTVREVIDLLAECKKNSILTIVLTAHSVNNIEYKDATHAIYIKTPFYKNKNYFLRVISENWLSLALILSFLWRFGFRINIRGVAWISPSIFNVWCALFLKTTYKAKIYLILRDLFPFWMSNASIIKNNGFFFRILKLIADIQMNISDRIGVESPSTISFFQEVYPKHLPKVEVLWNWMSLTGGDLRMIFNIQKISFIYAGNLGKAQGSEMFLALCERYASDPDVEIHFIGRGTEYEKILSFKQEKNIRCLNIHSQLSPEEIDDFIRKNSIGLVFLRPDLNASNIPGKFMSYVLNGLPVLASINPENDLCTIIKKFEMGRVDSSGQRESFILMAEEMIEDYRNSFFCSKKIVSNAQNLFSSQKAFMQLTSFLNNHHSEVL